MKMVFALRTAAMLLVLFTLLLGGVYPALVMGITQLTFSGKANGSLIVKDGKVVGSALLGQEFTEAKYFWGRLSATTPPYNAAASGASHFNPANPRFLSAVQNRIDALQKGNNKNRIPVDLVTASGSGLDPHISLAAAEYQISRIARARSMKESDIRTLVEEQTYRWLGTAYVNVLMLNMALDKDSGARIQDSGKNK